MTPDGDRRNRSASIARRSNAAAASALRESSVMDSELIMQEHDATGQRRTHSRQRASAGQCGTAKARRVTGAQCGSLHRFTAGSEIAALQGSGVHPLQRGQRPRVLCRLSRACERAPGVPDFTRHSPAPDAPCLKLEGLWKASRGAPRPIEPQTGADTGPVNRSTRLHSTPRVPL